LRPKLLISTILLLAACQAIQTEEAASPDDAVSGPTEALLSGCAVTTSSRWSVAVAGMPSFIVNLSTRQHETGGFALQTERITLTEAKFSYFIDPTASPDMATFDVAIAQLNSGVCGMIGKLQGVPAGVERSVTMVPLEGSRYAPRTKFL
jgi:hypothetical protein